MRGIGWTPSQLDWDIRPQLAREAPSESGRGGERRPRRDEARVGPPATAHEDLVTRGGALEVVAEVVAELVATDLGLRGSGAEGARTPGLRHAMAALFQLSYSPSELEICSKVNASA